MFFHGLEHQVEQVERYGAVGVDLSLRSRAVKTHRVGLYIADFPPCPKQRVHALLDVGAAACRGYAPKWRVSGFTQFGVAAGIVAFTQCVLGKLLQETIEGVDVLDSPLGRQVHAYVFTIPAQFCQVLPVRCHGQRGITAWPVRDRLQPDFSGVPIIGHYTKRVADFQA